MKRVRPGQRKTVERKKERKEEKKEKKKERKKRKKDRKETKKQRKKFLFDSNDFGTSCGGVSNMDGYKGNA